MLLAYGKTRRSSLRAALSNAHQTVQRCVERALPMVCWRHLTTGRTGKEPTIMAEAKAWLVDLACRKAKELGYPHELWTTRLLARHAREHGPAVGQTLGPPCPRHRLRFGRQALKPHKVRYYLERRDAEFETKMAEVLCVYREVAI